MCSIRLLDKPTVSEQQPIATSFKGGPKDFNSAMKSMREHEETAKMVKKTGGSVAKVAAGLAFATLFGIIPTACQKDDDYERDRQQNDSTPRVVVYIYDNSQINVNVDFDINIDITTEVNITQESDADAILAQMFALLQTYLPYLENLDDISRDVTTIKDQSAEFQRQVLSLLANFNLTTSQMLDVLNRIGYSTDEIVQLLADGNQERQTQLATIIDELRTSNQQGNQTNTLLSNLITTILHESTATRNLVDSELQLILTAISSIQSSGGSGISLQDLQTLLAPFFQKLAEISNNTYNLQGIDSTLDAILQRLTDYSNTMTNFLPVLIAHIDEIPTTFTTLMNQAMAMFQNYALEVHNNHADDSAQWEALRNMISYFGNALLQQGDERNDLLTYANNLMIQWQAAQATADSVRRADLYNLFAATWAKLDSLNATARNINITLGGFQSDFLRYANNSQNSMDSIIALLNRGNQLAENGVDVLSTAVEKIEMIRLGVNTINNNINNLSDSVILKLNQILNKIPDGCDCHCNLDGDSIIAILIDIYNRIGNGGNDEGVITDLEELNNSISNGSNSAKGVRRNGAKSAKSGKTHNRSKNKTEAREGTAYVLPNGMIVGTSQKDGVKVIK